jgi:hypothetical protein
VCFFAAAAAAKSVGKKEISVVRRRYLAARILFEPSLLYLFERNFNYFSLSKNLKRERESRMSALNYLLLL